MKPAIGIDLGGTKIEILAIAADGRELLRRRRPTPKGDYDATLAAIAGLVLDAEGGLAAEATVGIGHPGVISPATGLVKNANTTWINGQPFDVDLRARLDRPVALANDANCFALSEATDGAGAGCRTVFAATLGTGAGGGVVVDGRLLTGANGIAGEWGHASLGWPEPDELPGERCFCGQRGCVETWIGGPGWAADHARRTGHRLNTAEIAAAAASGEPDAQASVARYVDRVARSLAPVVNLIDPDVIVLGGGLSAIASLYRDLPSLIERRAFTDRLATPIRKAVHGDSSGVRGAAWLGRAAAA